MEITEKQRKFFRSNKTRDIAYRREILVRLKNVLKENEQNFYDAVYKDLRKSEYEAYATELSLVFSELNDALSNLASRSRKKRVRTNLVNLPGRSYLLPEPYGVCLVVSTWNYPFQLSLIPLISAVAAGNTVILKTSEYAPQSSAAIARAINSNFPPELMYVIEGDAETGKKLLENRFDKIFFTGSTAIGRLVYQKAAKHLTPVTLELGGKSPAFVFDDISARMAAKRIVWSKFLNSGQTCIAIDYILVKREFQEKLISLIISAVKEVLGSNPAESDNYVSIVNSRHLERLKSLLDKDKVVYGGEWNDEKLYLSPTIMKDVTFTDKVMEDEIFGPVLPVVPYDNLEEAINEVKDRPKPLSLYVFSRDKKIRNRLLNEISFGGATVNDGIMHISNPHLPFGGVGESGIGGYHGQYGFDAFTHYKSVLEKTYLFEPFLKYLPYKNWKKKILKLLIE